MSIGPQEFIEKFGFYEGNCYEGYELDNIKITGNYFLGDKKTFYFDLRYVVASEYHVSIENFHDDHKSFSILPLKIQDEMTGKWFLLSFDSHKLDIVSNNTFIIYVVGIVEPYSNSN